MRWPWSKSPDPPMQFDVLHTELLAEDIRCVLGSATPSDRTWGLLIPLENGRSITIWAPTVMHLRGATVLMRRAVEEADLITADLGSSG